MGHGKAWHFHIRIHTQTQWGRTGTRLCVPFRQSLLSADGPLMAPQLATESSPLQLAARPLTGQYITVTVKGRGGSQTHQYHHVHAFVMPHFITNLKLRFVCFPFHLAGYIKLKKKVSSRLDAFLKCRPPWLSRLRRSRGASCLSEILCALSHTCTHTYKHATQPLPLTPSCTAA